MRPFVRAALSTAALVTGGVTVATAQSAPKIAYIRSQDVLAVAPGRAEAEAQFQKELAGYRSEITRMGDSLQAMIADYNKAEVTLSLPAKQTRQADIRKREDAYQQRRQQLEQQASQREAELVRPIMAQIQQIIQSVRDEDGYAMIFDAQSQAGAVVAADKNLDITDKIITRVKAAGIAKGAPVAGTPTGPVANPVGVSSSKKPPTR
ncbi:MAG: OmpH family outer membrane protein [Gemmatimonadota bacterium]|nr:OmpH family outer membrane protein [Gemmatimonadota bacterium]